MHVDQNRRATTGFTMIELLVVIAIIGLISAVILSGVTSARGKGRQGAAMQVMKSVHDIAMVCISTNVSSYTFCLPGQNTLGCTASAIGDTNNGGGGYLCASNPGGRYTDLPTGWVYCDQSGSGQTATNCGGDASQLPQNSTTYFRIKAESNTDQKLIECTETGCVMSSDTN